jgi:GNAT superfamily N-acetyltransferase
MEAADEYFVGACSHVNESEEIDACAQRRIAWIQSRYDQGVRVKVALLDGEQAGFLYAMPIEVCPWGPLGRDLLVVPCLFVPTSFTGQGAGDALLAEAENEAHRQGKKGLLVEGFYHDFWFMPASYFEDRGFEVARRQGKRAALWKVWDDTAEAPTFLEPQDRFELLPGQVVVDLFWNRFCLTSDMEAQRVREVVAEFGDRVALREYDAGDAAVLCRWQRARGIFANGAAVGWGYTAPREGIRDAIKEALTAANAETKG